MPLYNTIGAGYAKTRPFDPRIVDSVVTALALPPGGTLLDVGAGTGKYSRALADRGFRVISVEPSSVMRDQSVDYPNVRHVTAHAEELPLPSNSADGAFIILALHHFADRAGAMSEILRVIGDGPLVVFTFEPRIFTKFWLADYFPKLGREIDSSFSRLDDVSAEISALTARDIRVVPFPLPRDLHDKFAAAAWATPESYLDADVRNGISSFALIPPDEVEAGLKRLASDLESGLWDQKYGSLRTQLEYDAGYRFIIAEPTQRA